jgi:hypothetical protein
MTMKRIIAAMAACFVLLSAGRYLIHNVWLADDYLETISVWRPQDSMLSHLWILYVANLVLAVAAVLIYVRGVEPKPWLGQGLRFGILLALVTAVPQSLVEFVVYPIPHMLAIRWIIGEGALAVLLGALAAAICKPEPELD